MSAEQLSSFAGLLLSNDKSLQNKKTHLFYQDFSHSYGSNT
jgi:hypothetical protein